MKSALFSVALMVAMALPGTARAVNFYDGVRAPQGLYLLSYTSLYAADEKTGKDGKVAVKDLGFKRYQELVRLSYYQGNWCAHLMVPAAWQEVGAAKKDDLGFGDINLGFGYFVPIRSVDLLPILFVKGPTGSYDKSNPASIGENQWDLKPTLFLHKTLGPWTVDLAAKYFYRSTNKETKVAPMNEFYAEGLFGYEFWQFMKLGLSLNYKNGDGQKWFDEDTNGARAKEAFSVGSDVYFRFKPVKLSFTYLYDAYTANTTQGQYFQIKTVWKF